MFKPTSSQIDFPSLERDIQAWWYSSGVVKKYLVKNKDSKKKFSFLDGPMTANNPMGVHHGWGRSFKDLWQKYYTMKGFAGRYQNGFDCQGLWVEVEVEKELGFKSKKDIEVYGVAAFVEKCKERVLKYSAIQTEQSKRLGYFMDWDNSYFTMDDENNYKIWEFIKVCADRGWLYKGHDAVAWCPRCETAISQHEMLTEDYKTLTHESVYLKLPLVEKKNESLLIWTTTPWTVPANIAVAVNTELDYSLADGIWLAHGAVERVLGKDVKILKTVKGSELVGLKYSGPYDDLVAVQKVSDNKLFHTVIATDAQIMPITATEGTGMVHTAVSAGEEDFKLGKKLGLPLIPVIADNADYLEGLGELTGKNAKKHPELILDYLKTSGWALKTEQYTHRYPACWRCKTELVWKVADEWYISMDTPDPSDEKKRTFREQMMDNAKQIHWLPEFGLDRELDWLKNMHDWLISKKNRYWGLALPIYENESKTHFEVIGSKEELQTRAVSGWEKFDGHTPHRPFIDEVKIKSETGEILTRITDVGNPWLDAGIVPFSTMPKDWFPADFITESFPGQFKNWFYAMIAMSTVLAKTNPFRTVLGYGSLLAEDGRAMHKSWGNSIEFNEGADKIGVDVMRWMYVTHNPADNLLFGYKKADEVRRRFHLIIWNVYNFFTTYANLDKFKPSGFVPVSALDRWIIARLSQTIEQTTQKLDAFDPQAASTTIESFVSDLSLWYIRRSRDRVGPSAQDIKDKQATHEVLHTVLVTLMQLLAPFMPFMTEEIYKNLTGNESIHLSDWPTSPKISTEDIQLIEDMKKVRKIVEFGLSKRKENSIKVRQPLQKITISGKALDKELEKLILDELNIKKIEWTNQTDPEITVELDLELSDELKAEGQVRELARQVQDLRKQQAALLDQQVIIHSPFVPEDGALISLLKQSTLAKDVIKSETLHITLCPESESIGGS